MQELQETNVKQLRVIRELSEQAEADKEEIRRKYQAEHEAEMAKLREDQEQTKLEQAEMQVGWLSGYLFYQKFQPQIMNWSNPKSLDV
jgi:uncharacterized protein (DUF3084 family)